MDYRAKKRVIIAFIYILLWFGFFFLVWLFVKGPSPSCFDGIKNQKETGIDCGGPCRPCISEIAKKVDVLKTGFIRTIAGRIDVYAQIENKNQDFGVADLVYRFEILNELGEIIATKSGRTFILPQQKRYVIEQSISVSGQISGVNFFFDEPQWAELNDYQAPNIAIKDKVLRQSLPDENGFVTLEGLIINSSDYDFAQVEVIAILKNQFGEIIALGKALHNTITSGEERIFKIIWPYINPELQSTSVEAYALTNVFNNDNFLKAHGVFLKIEELK